MIDSIHACVDLLHVGYHVKDEYDPIILNVYHCLKVEGKNDEKYMLHIDSVLNNSIRSFSKCLDVLPEKNHFWLPIYLDQLG